LTLINLWVYTRFKLIQNLMMNKKSSIIDIESLLGIDPTWSNKKIQAHLGKEFAKWNGL